MTFSLSKPFDIEAAVTEELFEVPEKFCCEWVDIRKDISSAVVVLRHFLYYYRIMLPDASPERLLKSNWCAFAGLG